MVLSELGAVLVVDVGSSLLEHVEVLSECREVLVEEWSSDLLELLVLPSTFEGEVLAVVEV